LKLSRVHCCWHDNQFEVFSLCQNLLNEAKQHVCVQCTLMGLVENNDWIFFELVIEHGLSEKHTVSHVFENCFSGSMVFESDWVTNFLTQFDVHLLADSLSDWHCSDPSWLGAGNGFSLISVTSLDEELGNLCGFTRACLSDQDQSLILSH
jgi:hypothetical protein